MKASAADVTVLLLYLALMLYMGYRGYRRSRTSSDYLLAGRTLGYGMYVGCLAALALGGASTVGTAKLGYEHGISGIWLVTMIGLGIVALGALLGTKLSNLGVLSLSEMLEIRYDGRARLASALITAVYAAMVAVTQVIAMGTILSPILGWTQTEGILLGGSVVLLYTFLGGMWSVSTTDFVQFVFMTIGVFFLVLPLGIHASGGLGTLLSELPPAHLQFDTIGYGSILSYFLLFFLGLIIGQDIWQRVFTARDAKVARRGTILAGVYCIAYAFAMALIGMIASVRFPALEDSQAAFATVAIEMLPSGLAGIVLAASLSALMSTASGTLLASATVLASDVYRRFMRPELDDARFLWTSRLLTGILGIGVVTIALFLRDVITALDVAYTFLTGAVFMPVVAALFWKRATAAGTVVSMCVSAVAAAVAMIAFGPGSTPPIVIGLLTSLAVLVVVSYLTAPPAADRLRSWEGRLAGGAAEK
jgi:solute:Na+ symporter, SSS family